MKQVLIHRVLGLRRAVPELFRSGGYLPLEVSGPLAAHITAFVRSLGSTHCLCVAPRLPAGLVSGDDSIVIAPTAWQGTTLRLPEAMIGQTLGDVISGVSIEAASAMMPLPDVLTELPVALLAKR